MFVYIDFNREMSVFDVSGFLLVPFRPPFQLAVVICQFLIYLYLFKCAGLIKVIATQ